MTTTSIFSKTLGQNLADASEICQVTTTSGDMGIHLSVVQSPGLDRSYRIKVPSNATGSGVFRRIVPYDATEKFPNQNHWAVDIMSVDNVATLRLVRTKAGDPASTTLLNCKVMASPSSGNTITIANSTTTDTGVTNAGIFEGAMITQMDGMVGINTDSPAHTLDVLGNVNTSETYKIGGNTALTSSMLGPSVTNSSLTTLGNLSSLNVSGNVALTGLSALSTTNVVFLTPSSGALTYGTLSLDVLTGNLNATNITGTLLTAAQPNITSVGNLSSLNVTGNVTAGNVSGTTLSGTFLEGTLQTADQPNITTVGTLGSLTVSGNVSAGNVSATSLTGTLATADQPNITSVGTLSSLAVTGNVTAGNVSGTTITGTNLVGTLQTAAQPNITSVGNLTSLNVTGNLSLNGSEWASSVIHGTTTPFLYSGPGPASTNGVSFYTQTQTNGTAFVTASGTNNSVFTFSTSGTYMLQAEVDVGYPWMPDGDINTYYLLNGNPAARRGNESHAPSNFSCTRPYLLTVNASDNVRFVIDSSSGNEYEVGLNTAQLTMLKLA
jgi:hypothetical protein